MTQEKKSWLKVVGQALGDLVVHLVVDFPLAAFAGLGPGLIAYTVLEPAPGGQGHGLKLLVAVGISVVVGLTGFAAAAVALGFGGFWDELSDDVHEEPLERPWRRRAEVFAFALALLLTWAFFLRG